MKLPDGRILVPVVVACIWIAWPVLLLDSTILFGHDDNLTKAAAFGDSFGAVSALMAAGAAAFAYFTFANERQARRLSEFESSFFSLLSAVDAIRQEAKLEMQRPDKDSSYKAKYRPLQDAGRRRVLRSFDGRAAFKITLYILRDLTGVTGFHDVKVVARSYKEVYDRHSGAFGHYFRTLYQVFRLIEERCPGDKQYYSRIVRAQLGNSELCLLCYNCIVGEGRFKFKQLACRFSVFHNLHRSGLDDHAKAELAFFVRKLPAEAFRFESFQAVDYND